eukprot:4668231-Amphidinium_carterae.1
MSACEAALCNSRIACQGGRAVMQAASPCAPAAAHPRVARLYCCLSMLEACLVGKRAALPHATGREQT